MHAPQATRPRLVGYAIHLLAVDALVLGLATLSILTMGVVTGDTFGVALALPFLIPSTAVGLLAWRGLARGTRWGYWLATAVFAAVTLFGSLGLLEAIDDLWFGGGVEVTPVGSAIWIAGLAVVGTHALALRSLLRPEGRRWSEAREPTPDAAAGSDR